MSALGVVDGTVSLSFTDAPPGSSVQLRVQSDPTGVDIAAGGDCSVDPAQPGYWLCSPSGAPSASPFTRMLASAVSSTGGDSTYTVDFPLQIPADQADLTKVTFEYLLEDEDAEPGSYSLTEPLRIANVGLSAGPEAAPTLAAVPDVYWLKGSVPAVPGDVTTRTFTLSGDAAFLPNDACSVGADLKTATCTVTPAGGPVDFLVSAAGERASATPVTIAAASVPGFLDPDVTNNTATFSLPASPTDPDPDPDPGDGDGDEDDFDYADDTPVRLLEVLDQHTYRYEMPVSGVEEGGLLTLRLEGSQGKSHIFETADSCSTDGDAQTATCTLESGATEQTVVFTVRSPGNGQSVSVVPTFNGTTLAAVVLPETAQQTP